MFPAIIETAFERLRLLMGSLMGSNISFLSKRFTAEVTVVRSFACVPSLMGLEIDMISQVILVYSTGLMNTFRLPN